MDRKTDAVLKERVAESTRGGYDGRNVTFMTWLFDSGDKYQKLLEPGLLAKMHAGHAKDKARRTKKGRPCKLRDNLRLACFQAIAAIDKEVPQTVPVMLESLSFRFFSGFLSTFKKKEKKSTLKCEDIVVDTDNEQMIRLSPSSYDGACSAL